MGAGPQAVAHPPTALWCPWGKALHLHQNNSAVTHDLRAVLPSFVALRLVRAAVPGVGHTVRFDYGDALLAYAQAVSSGAPLAATGPRAATLLALLTTYRLI